MNTPSQSASRYPIITLTFTLCALIAFAANSVLARLALIDNNIDPLSFTSLRLLSGAIMLAVLVIITSASKNKAIKIPTLEGSAISAIFLFIYALCFSIAYLSISTGTGALILFGAVQITMIIYQLLKGNKLKLVEWVGIGLAFSGFVYLVLPSLSTPSFSGFLLMVISGVAWAGYTIRGKGSRDPLSDTAGNFIRSLPLCLIVLFYILMTQHTLTNTGITLAIISGAITSGVGYAIWYIALKGLSATQAGIVQLLVPVIAALGGMILVQEPITMSFVVASIMILSGILLITLQKK
ncbi:DMT family transporter [Vibrio sp. CK2-1]|uniref:DMT family transporter n=1 Tax=Vibrio sp. CK2-1 TaxID=2912249 RepID=UPI001F1DF2A7|nr:DMT family transporter [Vibrio sp. CK2-1]MCF7352633.1 DMT family transporter [Vibrio sp. CK2-1]